ncbi:MAG: hypothetical protein ACRCVN_01185 [Spirochaetia bacterium]
MEEEEQSFATEFLNDTSIMDEGSLALGINLDAIIEPIIWRSHKKKDLMVVFRIDGLIYLQIQPDAPFTAIGQWEYHQNLKEFKIKNTSKIRFDQEEFAVWNGGFSLENGEKLTNQFIHK